MNFLLYGEDCRHAILSDLLLNAGHIMQAPAELLILSPKESLSSHTDCIKEHCLVWGGSPADSALQQELGCKKITQSDRFRVKNSVYTAEGALALAISESRTALCDSNIVVLGYGYLGKECARLFSLLSANVTVYTENLTELANAIQNGYSAKKLTELSDLSGQLILNTIPSPVLDRLPITGINNDTLLIELASIPCLTKKIDGLRIIPAGALPSRYSPESAARLIFEEIIEQIKKE